MYVCLDACKTGYKKGCRPIIGVDGCHLKGAYPGMILCDVSKDRNNNVFHVSWAVVEVENISSWTWFLELLMNDTSHHEGEGLSLMLDRQKGLIEAISTVAPKVNKNFKQELEGIKFISGEAYKFLDDIPAMHWSRHAFSTTTKSNMVTNNICETFNAVIKEARDKPIITCLEWIRRYIMTRQNDKWDGVQTYNGRYMPYIGRVLGWIEEGAKSFYPIHSRGDEWEVVTIDDRVIVNLRERTCSCIHFIERPEDYVDACYTKERFLEAYSSHIKPMLGFKYWEPASHPEPLPPSVKTMPVRPSLKKRKKEVGEEEEHNAKKVKRGGQQTCSKCGEYGHKNVKCKKDPVAKSPPKKGGRPLSDNPWVVAERNKREERTKKKREKQYVPPFAIDPSSNNNVTLPQTQTSCNFSHPSSQPRQSSSTHTATPRMMPTPGIAP